MADIALRIKVRTFLKTRYLLLVTYEQTTKECPVLVRVVADIGVYPFRDKSLLLRRKTTRGRTANLTLYGYILT